MKFNLCLYLLLFSCISTIEAQITFEKTYGTAAFEEANSIRQTLDGGYILGGTNLVKVNDTGAQEWSQPYPALFASPTSDTGYILIDGGSSLMTFTKVASNGDTIWQTDYSEGLWSNEGEYIEQVQDGGYIVAGRFQSFTGSGMLLLKLDSEGKKVWQKTFSETTSAGFNYGFSAQETQDNGFIIAGYSNINHYDSTRHRDVIIVKTDSVGNEQWREFYGGINDDQGSFVKQDADGNFFISGTTHSYGTAAGSNMYLIKLNGLGDSLWTQTYGGSLDETATGLWPTNDGGCIMVGSTVSFTSGDQDGYMVKTDSDGNELWTKEYGGLGIQVIQSVQQTADGGYAMAGYTNSTGAGDFDMFMLKTDSLGDIIIASGIEDDLVSSIQCEVYPNPNTGLFSIRSELKISSITFTDVLGKTIYSAGIHAKSATFDLSHHPKGIYYYQALLGDNALLKSGKLIFKY